MALNNRSNLGNDSAPWARDVEAKLSELEQRQRSLDLLLTNSLSAINGTLRQVSTQQNALAAQQAALLSTTQRIVESSQTVFRTGTYVQTAAGLDDAEVTEFSAAYAGPSWATSAVVTLTTAKPSGTLTFEEDAFIIGHGYASGVPINTATAVQFETMGISSSGQDGWTFAALVELNAAKTVYFRHDLQLSYVTTANISFRQAIGINWF